MLALVQAQENGVELAPSVKVRNFTLNPGLYSLVDVHEKCMIDSL